MKRRTVIHNGLGFPVTLKDWPMIAVFGEEVPDINYGALTQHVFVVLTMMEGRLLGAQLKFIRHFLSMTQAQFAQFLKGYDRSRIAQWERKDLEPTGMPLHAEIILRMQLRKHLNLTIESEFEKIGKAVSKSKIARKLVIPSEQNLTQQVSA